MIEHLFDELRILIGAYGKRGADGIVATFGCHVGKFIETKAIACLTAQCAIVSFMPVLGDDRIPLLGIINAFNDFDAFIICPGQKRIETLLVFVRIVDIRVEIGDGDIVPLLEKQARWLDRAGSAACMKQYFHGIFLSFESCLY